MSERDAVRQALWHEMERIGGGWNADNMARVAIATLDAYRAGIAARATARAPEPTAGVLSDIATERQRQNAKWGIQRHGWGDWIAILGEEFGEASKAAVEVTFNGSALTDLRTELIHVAAVATQIAEHVDELIVAENIGRDIAARNAGQGVRDAAE